MTEETDTEALPDEALATEAEFNQHAPGSWHWHEYKLVDKHPHYGEFRSIVGGRGFRPHGFFLTGYISEEDANKIIATPDLIAALGKTAAELENLFAMIQGEAPSLLEDSHSYGKTLDALEAARAALALIRRPVKVKGDR